MPLGYMLARRAGSHLGSSYNHKLSPTKAITAFIRTSSTDVAAHAGAANNGRFPAPALDRSSSLQQSPRSTLTERLERVPVRRHGELDPVVTKLPNVVSHPREKHEEERKLHHYTTQQRRLEVRRRQPYPGDWRVILHNLLTWTPTRARRGDKIKVVFPKDAAQLLQLDREGNVWSIKSRTGCTMRAYWPDKGETRDKNAYIILSGQPAAITSAVDDILKITKKVTVWRLRNKWATRLHEGDTVRTSARNLMGAPTETTEEVSHYRTAASFEPYILTMRADEIPRPSVWDHATFEQYIASLTMGRMPPSLARKKYDGPRKHKEIVVQQLLAAFQDPAARSSISTSAFKLALQYLVRSGETLVGPARELFDTVSKAGLRMDTDVFNLMAETSVTAKNLLAFQSTIRLMLARGHPPNLRTWLLFLRIIEAEEVRRYIMEAMETKGFFDDVAAIIGVSNEMASLDAFRAIQLGQSAQEMLDGLQKLYGPGWRLTRHAGNKMLSVFGQYGKFDQARVILDAMFGQEDSGKSRPTNVSLNILLNHCRYQNKLDEAINFIKLFDERGLWVHDNATFHCLFLTATCLKKPHLASAVWRYAHLMDVTTWRMRHQGLLYLWESPKRQRLLSRLANAGLWDDRHEWRYTKQQFIENLFYCDHRQAEGDSVLAGSPDTDGAPDRPNEFRRGLYDTYAEWAAQTSRKYGPALALGTFLEKALARDRELLQLARQEPPTGSQAVPQTGVQSVPQALLPVKLPIGPRPQHAVNRLVLQLPSKPDEEAGQQSERGIREDEHRTEGSKTLRTPETEGVPERGEETKVLDALGEEEGGEFGMSTDGPEKQAEEEDRRESRPKDDDETEVTRRHEADKENLLHALEREKTKLREASRQESAGLVEEYKRGMEEVHRLETQARDGLEEADGLHKPGETRIQKTLKHKDSELAERMTERSSSDGERMGRAEEYHEKPDVEETREESDPKETETSEESGQSEETQKN
ncbi:Reticulocyte-binding protein 2 a [Madurella mycetomatis]|uniref:Reticulocyte-binding protein 2 a n=1 Tax=Madurella mycetomatis TaxID=100816 RepID=A0A175VP02_9PEZI|nr:Reticulocyte-binding protein 2 a [Madurella mycetomatis]